MVSLILYPVARLTERPDVRDLVASVEDRQNVTDGEERTMRVLCDYVAARQQLNAKLKKVRRFNPLDTGRSHEKV